MTPALILVCGRPAVGKSYLTRLMNQRFGIPFVDKDDIKDVVADYFTASDIADYFSYAILFKIASSYLKNGSAVICDSPFSSRFSFFQAKRLADKLGAPLKVIRVVLNDSEQWEKQMNSRKDAASHRYKDWDLHKNEMLGAESYTFAGELIVDSACIDEETLKKIVEFLVT